VRRAVELEHEPQFGAIEVHDETSQDVLPAKLEPEHAAIPEQRPSMPLGRCGTTPQRPRDREFLPVRIGQPVDAVAEHVVEDMR
jgi:hypothetical protein